MASYSITPSPVGVRGEEATRLALAFTTPAPNPALVRDAEARMLELRAAGLGGRVLVLLTGPASLPVLAVIVHHIDHLFGAVAVFDPKLAAYVVCITHDPRFAVGGTIAESEVVARHPGHEGDPH
jgi:CRISPR-associated protein Csx3